MRWGAMFACAAARAVASPLLGMLHSHGGDGRKPATYEVEGDHRYARLVGLLGRDPEVHALSQF